MQRVLFSRTSPKFIPYFPSSSCLATQQLSSVSSYRLCALVSVLPTFRLYSATRLRWTVLLHSLAGENLRAATPPASPYQNIFILIQEQLSPINALSNTILGSWKATSIMVCRPPLARYKYSGTWGHSKTRTS
jgi:hypothetical protein